MTITIDEDVCKKYGLTLQEVLLLLLVKTEGDTPAVLQSLEEKEAVVKEGLFNRYLITSAWDDKLSGVLLDSDKNKQPQDRIENLALSMMEIFPKQKKSGTCHYFRGNKKDITLRLKKFFKLYGDKYSDEQILDATKRYVESFNGNYAYMRVLKYFIWKDEVKRNSEGEGYVAETSDLATFIENSGVDEGRFDWTSSLN